VDTQIARENIVQRGVGLDAAGSWNLCAGETGTLIRLRASIGRETDSSSLSCRWR